MFEVDTFYLVCMMLIYHVQRNKESLRKCPFIFRFSWEDSYLGHSKQDSHTEVWVPAIEWVYQGHSLVARQQADRCGRRRQGKVSDVFGAAFLFGNFQIATIC